MMKNSRWLGLTLSLLLLPALALAQWTETVIDPSMNWAHDVTAGDIDGDGDLDAVAGGGTTSGVIRWYENTDGVGGSWTIHAVVSNNFPEIVKLADMDGDSDLDILSIKSVGSGELFWYENANGDGSSWTLQMIDNVSLDTPTDIEAFDMDGDSDLDVIAAIRQDDTLYWYENDNGSATSWTQHTVDNALSHVQYIEVADFDNDTDADIIATSPYSGTDRISFYENTNGSGTTWSHHQIDTTLPPNDNILSQGDVDGDGDLDIMIGDLTNSQLLWYENDWTGSSSWTQHVVATGVSNGWELTGGDMDGDGDFDLVNTTGGTAAVVLYTNTAGDGSAWTASTVDNPTGAAKELFLADVSGDGMLDIFYADLSDDNITWYENPNTAPPVVPTNITLSGTVTNSAAVSEGVQAGLFSGTTDGYDEGYDIPKPAPPASDYLDVYFPHAGWAGGVFGDRWGVDVRDADADLVAGVHIYEITSTTDQLGEDVTLTFTLDGDYPAEHPVILHDASDDTYQDLRSNNVYTYTDAGSRTLNLRVGDLTDPDIAFTSPVDGDDLIATSTHTITFTYSDISAAESHTLEYSVDGQATWTAITTLADGDLDHDWTVPNVFTTDARLRLTSLDVAGNDSTIVSGSFTIAPNTYSTDVAIGYQMISPPLTAADPSNDAVFGDDLTSTYFVWEWDPTTDYVLTDTTTLGEGYWLASDAAVTVDIEGDAELDSSTTALASGWNMVGSGMIPQIAKTDVVIHDGSTWNSFDDAVTAGWISTALYAYDNGSGSYALDDSLDAFDGYWLYALTSGLTMSTYPTPSGEFTELDDFDPEDGWLLPIALEMGAVGDQVAGLGVHLDATDEFDPAYDLPVAPLPPAGPFIRAVFDHNDWDSPAGRWYAQDVRGSLADDEELSYTFLIQSNETGAFTLSFGDEAGELPAGLPADVGLTAIIDGNAYNLREQSEFALNYEGSYIYVEVIVNGALDVADKADGSGLPMAYELAPAHPNPFNPTTTLAVSLPDPGELKVTVYNVTGRHVVTLVNGTRSAGVHTIMLDGARLTSGVYFVHATVPGHLNQVRKVVLMK